MRTGVGDGEQPESCRTEGGEGAGGEGERVEV